MRWVAEKTNSQGSSGALNFAVLNWWENAGDSYLFEYQKNDSLSISLTSFFSFVSMLSRSHV